MNAIILAAGVGHRMMGLTREMNKTLLPVGGVPMIERTIGFLQAAGIMDITIITGHKHELFQSLEEKYHVKLVRNKKYSVYNNLYSLQLVLDQLGDTFLIHGDVSLLKNLFLRKPSKTTLYTTYKQTKGIPHLEIESHRHILKGFHMCKKDKFIATTLGIVYIAKPEADIVKEHYQHMSERRLRDYKGELEYELFSLSHQREVQIIPVDSHHAVDVNVKEEYYDACIKYEQLEALYQQMTNNETVSER